jgi:hypothetical protein
LRLFEANIWIQHFLNRLRVVNKQDVFVQQVILHQVDHIPSIYIVEKLVQVLWDQFSKLIANVFQHNDDEENSEKYQNIHCTLDCTAFTNTNQYQFWKWINKSVDKRLFEMHLQPLQKLLNYLIDHMPENSEKVFWSYFLLNKLNLRCPIVYRKNW